MENLEEQAKHMTLAKLDVKIQYFSELMHEAYIAKDLPRRLELGRQRKIYQSVYDSRSFTGKKP